MVEQVKDCWEAILLTALGGMTTGIYTFFKKKLKEHLKEHEELMLGMKVLLQDRLVQAHEYYFDKGYCRAESLQNVHDMYQQYKKLGGNGAIDELVSEVTKLPHNDLKRG